MISPVAASDVPCLRDVHSGDVNAYGSILLEWRLYDGTTVHESSFFVFDDSNHWDVIIGVETLVRMEIVVSNRGVLLPMMAHQKLNLGQSMPPTSIPSSFAKSKSTDNGGGVGEKARMALLQEQQRQEKAALETRRLDSEKKTAAEHWPGEARLETAASKILTSATHFAYQTLLPERFVRHSKPRDECHEHCNTTERMDALLCGAFGVER